VGGEEKARFLFSVLLYARILTAGHRLADFLPPFKDARRSAFGFCHNIQ
jgi:hypothetical protein